MVQALPKIEFTAWLEKLMHSAQASMVEKATELRKPVRRAQTLRQYMIKLTEAPVAHVSEEIFTREELVYVLLCAAMFIHLKKFTDKDMKNID